MSKTMKQGIAVVLAILQVLVLLPVTAVNTRAADPDTSDAAETPVLNEMIVGTVNFQSFNFLGDNASGSDGVDYSSTFYYTDDFFSPSAVNQNAASTRENWTALSETELALASTSFDLTVAAYASNENNVLTATSKSWDNTYYPGKDKNAKAMLEACGFTNFQSYGTYDQAPTNDSIAYVIASKKIHVWDEYSQSNKDFTLIAVAVRGAGYGAEWASNVTIGDPSTGAIGSNQRHWGFDKAAKDVCASIQDYLKTNNINADAKYWITGFSRAGATANLVAGYVTDGAESTYYTHQRDVYGFTWECPQGAKTGENSLEKYGNIHNIINAMDVVPRVSPTVFNHERLGVDYVMPYYNNTTSAQNTTYYNNMYKVLKTIAVGADHYGEDHTYQEDPLISIASPSNYPYNKALPIYTMTFAQIVKDATDGTLSSNFGTTPYTGSNKLGNGKWYLDQWEDALIKVLFSSKCWDRYYSTSTTDYLTHRTRFIKTYQNDIRNVMGYLLDFSGPAFMGMIDKVIDAVGDQVKLSNAYFGMSFLNFYNDPTGTYEYTLGILKPAWVGPLSWVGTAKKEKLIELAKPVVRTVVHDMTSGFTDPQGITQKQLDAGLNKLVEIVVDMYAVELDRYEAQYFGTTLHYMWEILSTHEQEVVMSWIKSLDPMHTNRGYRTVTLPKNADVKLYEFRAQYGEELSATGTAPLVAEFKDGAQVSSLDQRIYAETSGSNIIIRYPASLDIRIDVTTDSDIADLPFSVADYQTQSFETALSAGESQYQTLANSSVYTDITNTTAKTNAKSVNDASNRYTVPLSKYDTFQIMANATTTFDNSASGDKDVYTLNKLVYVDTVVEGQLRDEADGEKFYPDVIDRDGNVLDAAAQVLYTSNLDNDGHTGSSFTVTLPALADGVAVKKYFITDASQLERLSTETEAYLPDDAVTADTTVFTVAQPSTFQDVLESQDIIYHVFYSGDFTYTVTWTNDDGAVLETDENVKRSATPSYDGATPVKAADAQYTYTFSGWEPETSPVTADVTYKAVYDTTVNTYTITFADEDGTVLDTQTVAYGATPSAPADPTKPATKETTYAFAGWSPAITAVTGDATYTATYAASEKRYTVTWLDDDGSTVKTVENVKYAEAAANAPADPAKAATAQYTFTFAGWSVAEDLDAATITYTATYDATLRSYTVQWVAEDRTVLTERYAYGATPAYAGEIPTKEADAQYTYTFTGWDPAIATVTGDATYTAQFDAAVNEYTITWVIEGATETETYAYGATPSHDDPVKEGEGAIRYRFTGWTPQIADVTGDATYTAQFVRDYDIHYTAPDVRDGSNPVDLTGGENNGATVTKQPVYPSYMGYYLAGVNVIVGDVVKTVAVSADGTVLAEKLNEAIQEAVGEAPDATEIQVEAQYEREPDTYTVNLKYQTPDGALIDNYTTDPYKIGDAVELTAPATYTRNGETYYFDHWLVDGQEYKSQSITLRPNKFRPGGYDAVAVYAEQASEPEAVLHVINVYAETINEIAKTAVTSTWSVPDGATVKAVGFRVSATDPTLDNAFSTATSKLKTDTGTYTLHINVNTRKDVTVYVCAYLTYVDAGGTEHTITTAPQGYVWNELNQDR